MSSVFVLFLDLEVLLTILLLNAYRHTITPLLSLFPVENKGSLLATKKKEFSSIRGILIDLQSALKTALTD